MFRSSGAGFSLEDASCKHLAPMELSSAHRNYLGLGPATNPALSAMAAIAGCDINALSLAVIVKGAARGVSSLALTGSSYD